MASSKLFTRIYRTLPPESQQAFVEEQLAPLLDALSTKKRDRIIRAVRRSKAHFDDVPVLDLKGKKREMQTLFMMLSRDDKVAFTRERSNREEILQEAVHSISSWLNKIWMTVYEYQANFELAHECLLYAIKSLTVLEESPGAGECMFNNMYVQLALEDRERRTVKYFSFVGPRKLEQTCLWIWRDLFISMLVDNRRSKARVREMLVDIEEIMGWPGLEQLLYGGKNRSGMDEEDEDEYYDEDDEGEEVAGNEEALLRDYEDAGTDDEYDLDSDGDSRCCCRFHAKYWSDEMNEERITLREIIRTRLIDIFRDAPDADLFGAIGTISQDPTTRTMRMLLEILSESAGDSIDALKTALVVHTNLYHPRKILKLLEDHYHYLRPSDCPVLLPAIAILADSSCRPHALKFIERELFDSVRHIHVAIRSAFSHYPEELNLTDLADLLKLQPGSSLRASRVERWVNRVLTPGTDSPGPMAFAAMMMGFPVPTPAGSLDDADLLSYIDFSKPDPDLDDLREEFRPQLKPRFETWNLYAQTMAKDCAPIIHRTYAKIVELMPFFKGNDVVTEMTHRLGNRPSKNHIVDAMDCVLAFCKTYRKKYIEPRRRVKKTAPKTSTPNTAASPSSSATTGTAATTSTTPNPAPSSGSNPAPNTFPNFTPTATTGTGPVLHIFGPGHAHGSMPLASFFSNPLPNIHPAHNNHNTNHNHNPAPAPPPPQTQTQQQTQPPVHGPQPPTFGGQTPIITSPLSPPPECNHQ
ncbi:hypothetical protein D9756_001038 [Leucocoprinus leucothites]|uniref:Uncharacterized protein n=1 Tax=Leucocoprinus leucothites TaxID=201217 RepID=A0A8H5GEL6_9AGAR|nr:hypothetical protein D9756_001038 [Leucoagaricus leucothites]